MNKFRHLKMAKAFRSARRRILDSKNSMICLAISNLAANHRITLQTRDDCDNYIHTALQKRATYEEWLFKYHFEVYQHILRTGGAESFKEGRVQWLNHIIKVLES